MRSERGFATMEFLVGVCVLMLPMLLLVTLLPQWSEGRLAAETAADVAGRAAAVAMATDVDPHHAAEAAAAVVLGARDQVGIVKVVAATDERVVVEVTVKLSAIPLLRDPDGVDATQRLGFDTTARVEVLVDPFRSPDLSEGES